MALIEELLSENAALKGENKALRERIAALLAWQKIAQSLTSELRLEPLLTKILSSALEVMGASTGTLLLIDPATDELVVEAVEGGEEVVLGWRMAQDRGVAGWVVSHCRPLVVKAGAELEGYDEGLGRIADFQKTPLICVPLLTRGKVIGALEIRNKRSGEHFNDNDLDFLTTLAAHAATAIENARLYRHLEVERDRMATLEKAVRKRLERDLHDGPAQLLSAIIMSIQFARQILTKTPEKLDKLREELGELEPMAIKALNQIRTMLFDLRPVTLETYGLAPALEAYVEHLRLASDLAVNLEIEDFSERLDARAEAAIFAIVQEAVSNTRKHAHASHLELKIAKQDGNLIVSIRDDGQGFDVAQVNRSDRAGGLLNMRSRAEMLHGQLSIKTALGQGTLVRLTVPLQIWSGTDSGEMEG